MVFDGMDLGNHVGQVANDLGCSPACQHNVKVRVPGLEEVGHFVGIEVVEPVAHNDVDLIENNQVIFPGGDGFLAYVPDVAGGGDVLGGILRIPGKAVSH